MATIRTSTSRQVRSWISRSDCVVTKCTTRALTVTRDNNGTKQSSQIKLQTSRVSSAYQPSITQIQSQTTLLKTPSTTVEKTPFDTLINDITTCLTTTNHPSLPDLHNLLRHYTSNPEHWSKYAHGNPAKQYTRNLVYSVPGVFNLLLLVWTPGQKSPVHDHADAHCLMKVCYMSHAE